MAGKGKKFVPVLIPKDLDKSIDILVEHRRDYGIYASNIFVFASRGGHNHCSGFHALQAILNLSNIQGLKINATSNRYRISTIYTSLDMSTADAKIFFQHVSHTEDTSRDNYRCPPGLKEALVMGKLLKDVDEGRLYYIIINQ